MRLFVAIDLPEQLRAPLAGLPGGVPGARWIPPHNHHLTLRFIGDVQAHMAEEIDHTLAGLRGRAFDLTLAGIGLSSRAGRDVALWAGVERSQALDRLQSKIETALQRAGLPPERRRWSAHVTLARLDNADPIRVAAFVQARNLLRVGPARIGHFTLFSSILNKEASAYTAEVEYPLTAG